MMKKERFRIVESAYVSSAVDLSQCLQDGKREVAFIGRSNVGKSSIINSLCNHRGLAMVSREPGKTRTINYFNIRSKHAVDTDEGTIEENCEWYLVDLPGYGFAKTGKSNRDLWSVFIADYIQHSPNLALLCLLIDLRHPELPIDREAYEWLVTMGVPMQIIGTKSDKLGQSDKQKNLRALTDNYPTDRYPLAYSSLKHQGRNKLLNLLETVICE